MEFQRQTGITIFFFVIISMLMAVSVARADVLVGTDGPPGDGQVRRFSNNGAFIGNFTSGGPELDEPTAVQFGPDGNLYLLTGSDTVIRYNGTTGVFIDVFIPENSNDLEEAKDMVFGPDGNLYIAANCDSFCPPGVVGEGGRVMRFNGKTGAFIDDFIPNGAGGPGAGGANILSEAMAIAFGPDGNFYLGNDPSNLVGNSAYSVMRFSKSGIYIDTPFPAGFMGLYDPNGITVGPDCNLYISSEGLSFTLNGVDFENPNVIFRLNPATDNIDEFVPSNGLLDSNGPFPPGTGLIEPEKIVFGPDGNLYVTSGDTTEVYIYNGDTGALISFFPSEGDDPKGITFFPGESPVCRIQPEGIPTLSEWGPIGMAALLAVIGGLFAYSRRQRKSHLTS